MANKKISQLTAAAALTGTEVLPIVQGGETVQTTAQNIANLAGVPYQIYLAEFQIVGASDPIITVLENTMQVPIIFTRAGVGQFSCTLVGSPFGSDTSKFFNRSTIEVGAGSIGIFVRSSFQFIGFANSLGFTTSDINLSAVDGGSGTIEFRFYP